VLDALRTGDPFPFAHDPAYTSPKEGAGKRGVIGHRRISKDHACAALPFVTACYKDTARTRTAELETTEHRL
jgi:hypothetical protein